MSDLVDLDVEMLRSAGTGSAFLEGGASNQHIQDDKVKAGGSPSDDES